MSKAATIAAFLLEDDELDSEFDAKGQAMQPELKPRDLAVELGFSEEVFNLGNRKVYGDSPQFRLIVAIAWDAYEKYSPVQKFVEMRVRWKIGIRARDTLDKPKPLWSQYTDWKYVKLVRHSVDACISILLELDTEFKRIAADLNGAQDTGRVEAAAYRAVINHANRNPPP